MEHLNTPAGQQPSPDDCEPEVIKIRRLDKLETTAPSASDSA